MHNQTAQVVAAPPSIICCDAPEPKEEEKTTNEEPKDVSLVSSFVVLVSVWSQWWGVGDGDGGDGGSELRRWSKWQDSMKKLTDQRRLDFVSCAPDRRLSSKHASIVIFSIRQL